MFKALPAVIIEPMKFKKLLKPVELFVQSAFLEENIWLEEVNSANRHSC